MNKAQEEKQRSQKLKQFVSRVTEHIFDRNPATIKESMNILPHEELDDKTVEKLQNQKLLPETELDVLKIIDESKAKNRTNKIVVTAADPVGDVEKDVVTFKVTGKDVSLEGTKEVGSKDIALTITLRDTPEMGDFPRVIDVVNDTHAQAPVEKKPVAENKPSHHKHRR